MRITPSVLTKMLNRVPPPLQGQILRYGFVGVLSTAIYFGLVAVLVDLLGYDAVASSAAVFAVIIVLAYVLNRYWVFRSTRRHASAFTSFLLATLISMTINVGIMHVIVNVLDWWYVVGLVAVTATVPPINFLLNYLWCFAPTRKHE